MGSTAKIIFLNPKSPVVDSDNPDKKTKQPVNKETFF